MKKRIKGRFLVTVVLIAALMIPGAVYAYFTDYETAVGGAVIELNGETRIEEHADDEKKVIAIENTGEADVIVRASIYADFIKEITKSDDDWTEKNGFYYYNHILKSGEKTSEITVVIDKEEAEKSGHDFEIVVVHESERVVYDGTKENHVVKPSGWELPDIAQGLDESEEEAEE